MVRTSAASPVRKVLKTDPAEINIPTARSQAVSTVKAALEVAEKISYPVIVRAAYTLGGLGSGFANDPDELRDLAAKSLSLSPQVRAR